MVPPPLPSIDALITLAQPSPDPLLLLPMGSTDCGGGYIKLYPPGLDPSRFDSDTEYNIMFGVGRVLRSGVIRVRHRLRSWAW